MERFIQKNEFAKLCGVSKPAITKAAQPGKALSGALVEDKIDLAHVDAITYAKRKNIDLPEFDTSVVPVMSNKSVPKKVTKPRKTRSKTPPKEEKTTAEVANMFPGAEVDTRVLMNLTVSEVAKRYGGMKGFKEILAAQKIQSDIQYRELQNAEKRGEMIPRDIVEKYIFGHLETSNLRLLRDFPQTCVQKIFALVKSGQSPEEAEKEIRIMVGKVLEDARSQTLATMKEAKAS